MKKFTLILIVCSIFLSTNAQNIDAYRIFTNLGYPVDFSRLVESEQKGTVYLFGELHDNPISHWLQLELTIALHKIHGKSLILGAEMFETDNQIIIDEYLNDLISQSRFEAEARIWPNYKTDYKPLVEFAKENNLYFIASNIPRRYASMVASGGFEVLEKLSVEAKSFIAPLPIEYDSELPGYKAMLSMMGMPGKGGPSNDNFPKAQAIKDATMGWNISKNFNGDKVIIHYHGTYHSNNYEGIAWYLSRYAPNVKIITIATVLQEKTENLDEENLGLADFIIVVPQRMTRTY
ncbi:MAG: iron-regulated protein [Bacteroidetes bacterium HGW-Bacteroidetes-15]|nr:MAG: iron-regulated protein [Bacteroidetes bacterium HGW-Bacteroidetes-15]